jgi:hypothetical protein
MVKGRRYWRNTVLKANTVGLEKKENKAGEEYK